MCDSAFESCSEDDVPLAQDDHQEKTKIATKESDLTGDLRKIKRLTTISTTEMTTSDEDREMCDSEHYNTSNTETKMCNIRGDVMDEKMMMDHHQGSNDESGKDMSMPDLNALAAMAAVITPNQMAQLAAQAMANPENENVIKNLALLQSTIFSLQHQQVLQLQLIQKLQTYLVANPNQDSEDGKMENGDIDESPAEDLTKFGTAPDCKTENETPIDLGRIEVKEEKKEKEVQPPREPSPAGHFNSSISSSIITNHDTPPSMDAPNSLEMLERRAQEVLDSASHGILSGNLADELTFRKDALDGKNGRNDHLLKHRCRYCGKIFGSDSALQIHLRSHTGERPFKCNVCGSRFTTKGNLKVHFQRHTSNFPNIPMGQAPMPEYLEKMQHQHQQQHQQQQQQHQQQQQQQQQPQMPVINGTSPLPPMPQHAAAGAVSFFPNFGFPGLPPYRLPLEFLKSLNGHPSFPPQLLGLGKPFLPNDQESPTDLRKTPKRSTTPPPSPHSPKIKTEPVESPLGKPREISRPQSRISQDMDDCSLGSDNQPENLSAKATSQSPPNSNASSPREQSSPLHHNPSSIPDPVRDPVLYSNLLPRPGSNDSSWESLIEITKSSETTKLQQLVDNIEHKLSDPNECIVCHRVLSCRSALQMHYRTHTGERPFRCRICGRAFTTKGNLKTHMSVHRMKPPMRTLPQCPVCHKKFSNALVLQQHIRLHTGEPTDLTFEQIQAAEIRDFGSPTESLDSFHSRMNAFGIPPGYRDDLDSSQGDNDDYMDYDDDDSQDMKSDTNSIKENSHQKERNNSMTPPEIGDENGRLKKTSTPNGDIQGALDLTARATSAAISSSPTSEKLPPMDSNAIAAGLLPYFPFFQRPPINFPNPFMNSLMKQQTIHPMVPKSHEINGQYETTLANS